MTLRIHKWAGPWKGVCGRYVMDAARLAKPLQWEQVPEHRRCLRCSKQEEGAPA